MKRVVWRNAFIFWVVMTLSFMAGMGIGSGAFVLATLWVIGGKKDFWRQMARDPLGIATALFFFAAVISIVVARINPPLGMEAPAFKELQKFHYFLLPFFGAAAVTIARGSFFLFFHCFL